MSARFNIYPKKEIVDANNMAQNACGYKVNPNDNEKVGKITSKFLPSVLNRNLGTYMFYLELDENDWRAPIVSYLRNPNGYNDNIDLHNKHVFSIKH
jgi:hypothetical protein